ncbi:c-type cytochrome [Gillisia sp. M10.2A]|uniref:C-type cytochrome n=1 Tax=Gillisia lutea TaxID=2909668 RepID=A0ABS9EE09_9FLAO|nr:c-type cytochrome [Gillisia lutea]MCF4101112.1 c-type cytochrome [Gillisia lutea]
MNTFKQLIKALFYLFSLSLAFFVILFIALFIYNNNPSLFKKEEIAAAQWMPKDIEAALENKSMTKEVEYGYRLVAQSPEYMGPTATDPAMHLTGNNLACVNCHLENGTKPGSASWVGVTNRFPQFSGRSNKEGSIEDRINGCMERSMNGKKLPKESDAMKAIVAYMEWLSEDVPEEREAEFKGFPPIKIPEIAVDLEKGRSLYTIECQVCHGENGQGVRLADTTKGYQYPPLWGEDSYNHGAGMHRVITAAEFIKGNMPFGQATRENPKLTDEEAYHLAGYINSFSRPIKPGTEKDYPDLKLKPVSTPYGPWADDFSESQHKFGPYQPIIEFYKEKYDLTKTK